MDSNMSITFGSPEANVILESDKELIKQLKAYEAGRDRREEIKVELNTVREEIDLAEDELSYLQGRESDLVAELQRLEKGKS